MNSNSRSSSCSQAQFLPRKVLFDSFVKKKLRFTFMSIDSVMFSHWWPSNKYFQIFHFKTFVHISRLYFGRSRWKRRYSYHIARKRSGKWQKCTLKTVYRKVTTWAWVTQVFECISVRTHWNFSTVRIFPRLALAVAVGMIQVASQTLVSLARPKFVLVTTEPLPVATDCWI